MRPLVALAPDQARNDNCNTIDMTAADTAWPDPPGVVIPASQLTVVAEVRLDEVSVEDTASHGAFSAAVFRGDGGALLRVYLRAKRKNKRRRKQDYQAPAAKLASFRRVMSHLITVHLTCSLCVRTSTIYSRAERLSPKGSRAGYCMWTLSLQGTSPVRRLTPRGCGMSAAPSGKALDHLEPVGTGWSGDQKR